MSEAVMKTSEGDITLELFDEDAPKTGQATSSSWPARASTTG
jgi:hypothetical protein